MLSPYSLIRKLFKKIQFLFGVLKANTIGLFSKRDFVIIAFFTLLGAGGVFAAGLITISAPDAQGAGYTAATACDENVTIKALTAPHTSSGQLYVATIALSDISQNATTGCGNKIMQIALKINGQMSYASWSIPAASSDSTFYLTGATSSINTYYADTLLSPFQADGLTNVAISQIGYINVVNWTQRSPVTASTTRAWRSISSSADGTKLAAVVYNNYIYTSTDSGETWTQRSPVTASTTRTWISIASSSDGTKLAAAASGAGNYIYTSSDSGVTWLQRGSPTNWRAIASSADGTKLVAVPFYGYIATSTDSGASWNNQLTTPDQERNWLSIASSSDGTKLVAGENNGYIYTSSNSGGTWTQQTIYGSWYSVTSSSDGARLAAVIYNNYIYTSSNSGVSWTTRTSSGARAWYSITSSSDGTKLAVTVSGGYIYTSSDSGVTWAQLADTVAAGSAGTTTRAWNSITSSSDGTKLAATVNSGYIYTGTQ